MTFSCAKEQRRLTTLAGGLAELTGAVVLSTNLVRHELFGDAAVQGPWRAWRSPRP